MNKINPIFWSSEGIEKINEFIREKQPSKIFFLVDENTHTHCYPLLITEIETEAVTEIIEIYPGEENKNIQTCIQLWEILTELKADRKSLLINIGGGVLTDMGSFVGNTFKRGISFINIPTTLLAMVDASIGGKTGVDLGSFKNQIGTFALPEMVLIEAEFLNTLPQNQLLSGFAEIIKHGLIADENYWKTITSLDELNLTNLSYLIKTSIEIKTKVVSEDFTESGLRKVLNFGHTIGHAVESYFLNKEEPILHGEGVALGMITESYLSMKLGFLGYADFEEITGYLSNLYPKIELKHDFFEDLFYFMKNDKKNSNQQIKFVLLQSIGKAIYDIEVEKELIFEALEFYSAL